MGPSLYRPISNLVGKIGPMKQEYPHAPDIVDMIDLLEIGADYQYINGQHPHVLNNRISI